MTPARWQSCACSLFILCACEPRQAIEQNRALADTGPASRVVTLAPNLAELVFAVDAGDTLVGVSAFTDYPELARSLPVIGDAFMVDQEQLAILQPDLLLAWASGTPVHVVDKLRAAGYRIETIRTRSLDDVAAALEKIGALTGHAATASEAAAAFRLELTVLADQYAEATPIRVFYQISQQPIYTINGDHYVSELIGLCGGVNIFAELRVFAPVVSEEAVLERNPEVMLAAGDVSLDAFSNWQRWSELAANRYTNHFLLPAAEIGRASVRLSVAGKALCEALETARENRSAWRSPR